jgi:hypothetical protein
MENNLASLLRDFAQGASNSAATNLSMPVDAIAWLLRKGGMNIPNNPVGGSDWLAEKGFTPEPKNKLAGLLGDVAGFAAPLATVTKAPQIAKGLLQMGEAMPMGSKGVPMLSKASPMADRGAVNVGSKFEYPQSQALELAQQRAAMPLPPAGVDITKLPQSEARKYGLGLRADNTALERANASKDANSIFDMNFNNDVYHGTNADIQAFDTLLSDTRRKTGTPNGAIVTSTNPKTASTYAGEVTDDWGNIARYDDGGNVLPLKINTGNGLSVNAKGANWGDIFSPKYPDAETTNDIAQIALDKGKQSATIKNVLDNATWSKQNGVDSRLGNTIFSFNPDDIRSRFAAFDPWRRNAAIAATMGVAAPDLLANPLDDKNNRLIEILKRNGQKP